MHIFLWVIKLNINEDIINLLYNDAKKAFKKGDIPVSAVIIDKNGKIISHSYNNRQKKSTILGHAEIMSILSAEKKIKDWRLNGYIMISSLYPCDLCKKVIEESRLDKVYYLVDKKDNSLLNDFYIKINKNMIGNYDEIYLKFADLINIFFNNMR